MSDQELYLELKRPRRQQLPQLPQLHRGHIRQQIIHFFSLSQTGFGHNFYLLSCPRRRKRRINIKAYYNNNYNYNYNLEVELSLAPLKLGAAFCRTMASFLEPDALNRTRGSVSCSLGLAPMPRHTLTPGRRVRGSIPAHQSNWPV